MLGTPCAFLRGMASTRGLWDNYVVVCTLRFEWDESKNASNKRKHRVSFEDARSVFHDENARLIFDPEHSEREDRFVLLGMSERLHLLVVCHAYRELLGVVRIISARKANKNERSIYREHLS